MKGLSKCLLASVILLCTACTTSKYIYLKDLPADLAIPITNKSETHVKIGDRLAIKVNCKNPELAAPFNGAAIKGVNEKVETTAESAEEGYLVNDDGTINFPVLGKIEVLDLTMNQVSERIKQLLTDGHHLADASVTTQITNFTIYSLGGVTPKKLVVPEGHINLLQALAQMGDLQQRANLKKVRILRETGAVRIEYDVDVTTAAMFDSPAFHLQQNDIVYAEPRKRSNTAFNTGSTIISILAVLASLAYSLTYMLRD